MKMTGSLSRSITIVFFFLISIVSYSQSFPVTGKVTSASGEPLSGVTVQVKNGNVATATTTDGTFRLNVPSAKAILVFTYVGFGQKEVPVNDQRELNVSLSAQNTTMDEVVVVGYGSRKKGEVTGAITSISGENLRSVPTTNLTQALQGRLAGV
ncbi:MAG TPA: carboxypeptidase-like regulatory domain-containing protein, partial [Segetibacter sp.]|nr:carboxypeptidase-like regulatory domain-containing protein [Segetibacter sp.]